MTLNILKLCDQKELQTAYSIDMVKKILLTTPVSMPLSPQ